MVGVGGEIPSAISIIQYLVLDFVSFLLQNFKGGDMGPFNLATCVIVATLSATIVAIEIRTGHPVWALITVVAAVVVANIYYGRAERG